MIKFNDKIDAEFKQLGFNNGREIFATAELLFDFKYMYAVVPVKDTWALGYDQVNFTFVLTEPTKEWPNYISFIRATTDRKNGFANDEDRTTLLSTSSNPPLSTKDEMMAKIHKIEREKFLRYKEVGKIFLLGKIESLQRKKGKGLK